jgi:hypothetical protein
MIFSTWASDIHIRVILDNTPFLSYIEAIHRQGE